MSAPNRPFSQDELITYIKEMISETLQTGAVDPASSLECFLYALNPKLVSDLRRFTALHPAIRKEVLNSICPIKVDHKDEADGLGGIPLH